MQRRLDDVCILVADEYFLKPISLFFELEMIENYIFYVYSFFFFFWHGGGSGDGATVLLPVQKFLLTVTLVYYQNTKAILFFWFNST